MKILNKFYKFEVYKQVKWKSNKYNKMIEWIKKATSKNITGNYKFYVKS